MPTSIAGALAASRTGTLYTPWDSYATEADESVTQALADFDRFTLYLDGSDASDITVEISPDGGTTVYEIPESPLSYGAAFVDVNIIDYNCNWIRLTTSAAITITAQIRGIA